MSELRYKCRSCGKKRLRKYLKFTGTTYDLSGCNRTIDTYECINFHRCMTGQSYHIPESPGSEDIFPEVKDQYQKSQIKAEQTGHLKKEGKNVLTPWGDPWLLK